MFLIISCACLASQVGNSPGEQRLVSYPFLVFLLPNYVALNEKICFCQKKSEIKALRN